MQAGRALGIDLGGTKIEAMLLSAQGSELWRQRIATPAGDYAGTLRAIESLVQQARVEGRGPCSVGVGTPGSLTPEGLMKNANSQCLNGMPLRTDLQRLLGQPVRIANDANCLALSEATDGAGAGAEVVFAAILGTGTGAGIAVHGQVLSGPNGLAGEWGHNPLPWGVPGEDPVFECYCGQRGCIETLLSGPGLAREHRLVSGDDLSAAAIAARAAGGDAACTATLARYSSRLARALASVINLLDPDVIVLAGGLSNIATLYEQVPRQWQRWAFSGGYQDAIRTRLLPSRHGDASGVRGAAWLWRDTSLPD
ncbi:MAG TPA: ROK family protein [Rubrivivax sp.]|jgi:fructokinase|nr:ROK family protein [Rubrivivax sp.]